MGNRIKMLNDLSAKLPMLNQKVAQQKAAATGMGLQQAIQQAPTGAAAAGATIGAQAGQMAAGMQQQLGEAALGAQQATQQQAMQTGQEILNLRGQDLNNAIQQRSLQHQEQLNERSNALSSMGLDLKSKLFDSTMQFERDRMGEKFAVDRQLMDWAVTSARSANEAKQRLETMQMVADRKVKLLQAAHDKIVQAIQGKWAMGEQKLNQEQKKYLLELKRKAEEEIAAAQAKAKGNAGMITGLTSLGGAAVGAYFGGPGGAAAGAKGGEALGNIMVSQGATV